ncbi:DUF6380 family protein [Streptomyces sp. NPDC101165]|uniref:DUF6380 family protein n=1 Tax=Streptomyces sp. NPDC101165 TaxID=3366119 RepID=UPI0037FFABF5
MDSDGPMRRATLRCGVASLTATAERAPFIQHAKQAGSFSGALGHARKDAR